MARGRPCAPGSYAAFFVSLFVIAHLVIRVRLPLADPFLLPLCGLLCALGVTEIYRIDPTLAFRQGLWIVVGVVVFAAVVLFLRDYRSLDRVKYLLGLSAIVLLVLPALPLIGRTINGATLGSSAESPSIGLSATKTRPTNSTTYGSTIMISSDATMPAILATL